MALAVTFDVAQSIEKCLKVLEKFLKVGAGFPKNRQDLLRYLRVVHMLIRVLQTPFKQPSEFPKVKGFNSRGVDMSDIETTPWLKDLCKSTYTILASVGDMLTFLPKPQLHTRK